MFCFCSKKNKIQMLFFTYINFTLNNKVIPLKKNYSIINFKK